MTTDLDRTMAALDHSPADIARWRRERLADIVAHARANSPVLRELYRDLPDDVDDVTLLPITDKKTLMPRFADWVTDREVTEDAVRAFVDQPELAGELFLGKYLVTTTSGTSGLRGLFLHDTQEFQMTWEISRRDAAESYADDRSVTICATGGHFALNAIVSYIRKQGDDDYRERTRLLSVHEPIPALVAALNDFQPDFVSGYATVVSMLATEAERGTLRISPRAVTVGGEGLPEAEYARLATAFGAEVTNIYACNEGMSITYRCVERNAHLNADWLILEPVDEDLRPSPPGEFSHSVLLTNLLNRAQPILRYNLGDSIALSDGCACGSPMPVLRVRGRSTDELRFPHADGVEVLPSLVVETLIEKIGGIRFAQVAQTGPQAVEVRLTLADDADTEAVWARVLSDIDGLLSARGLSVSVSRSATPPAQEGGGKFRTVIPLG